MMSVIEVKNLAKKYHLGRPEPYYTLRDSLVNLFRKNVDRHLSAKEFWALKNISFDVQAGEILGIIGPNGAGKSTLLKILSRITPPTKGEAIIRGRVASLLEVGTGFNAELTGRENIFLSGSVLGMSQKEIKSKIHDIIAFAEIEKFMDTPVKYYSSGMYTRLAFAVAAHLDPEILIVDEVLSVGDIRFQKKSLQKMENLTKESGKTVLFVSHNLGAVKQLCPRTLLLNHGQIVVNGPTEEVIRRYISENQKRTKNFVLNGDLADRLVLKGIQINHSLNPTLLPSDEIKITLKIRLKSRIPNLMVNTAIYFDGNRLFTMQDGQKPMTASAGDIECNYYLPKEFLRPGTYSLAVGAFVYGSNEWCWSTDLANFGIADVWDDKLKQANIGIVNPPYTAERK